jgi:hypothetical protein
MSSTERRIIALEKKADVTNSSLQLVFVRDGETAADARQRAGHPANAIALVFCSPVDEKL